MYNRARPTADQPRADNRHSSTHTAKRSLSESRSRGPAAATAPASLPVKAAAHDHVAAHALTPNHPGTGGGGATPAAQHAAACPAAGPDHAGGGPVRSTLLQPRVAVALGVSKKWYPILFLCRLASIGPGVLFGLPNVLRLLATLHLMYLDRVLDGGALSKLGRTGGLAGATTTTTTTTAGEGAAGSAGGGGGANFLSASSGYNPAFEARLRLTEALLATIWCCASGYLSFFFTDCLMSRWLLHYTPQATIVRLLTVDAINGYLTSWVLHLTGGFEDPRLILPAWIVISTTLTVLYHITQRKINIRKETSMSISVFSIASFVSMVALLVQLHSNRSDYPDIPLLNFVRRVFDEACKLAMRIMEYADITREL
ncbi:N-glycosylation protein-domain-containing protein [Thermothelomyces heterothallicus CBS 202.75]|uniref:N-glycosylation protein-domain-containing protein n=1 Tax=Thermothelomyces heterothallicus CBS 202.75 TaxID=1149848 RepID=UPI0037449BF4